MLTGNGLTEEKKVAYMTFLGAHACISDAIETQLKRNKMIPLHVYDVLVTLEMADEDGLRMSDLASRVLYSRSGLTRLVDRLEANGYVTRSRCPEDRRSLWCRLTDEGARAREDAWPVVRDCMEKYFAAVISDDEATHLKSMMQRVIDAVSDKGASEACHKIQTDESDDD
ncbi:MAG: MarR family transcriptional regulator [Fimbriimonadaceae bacterium]|nr:MarR family transcriptional regulator [Fimbriimonadaceae bacterium]